MTTLFSRRLSCFLTLPLLGMASTMAYAAGDASHGKAAFSAKCAMCHAVAEGAKRLGPNLLHVVGRKAGSFPDYVYSPALAKSKITWNETTLDPWLQAPSALVPGTKMVIAGIKSPDERADIIAYLATLN